MRKGDKVVFEVTLEVLSDIDRTFTWDEHAGELLNVLKEQTDLSVVNVVFSREEKKGE